MRRPSPLLILGLLLLVAPLAAPAQRATGPFDHAVTAAEMITSVIKKAELRRVSGDRQIVLLWQDQPKNVNALAEELGHKLPLHTIAVAQLTAPYERSVSSLHKTWPGVVSIVAIGLHPDTLQLLSYWSRAHGVLTIGAGDDVDPLSVGLELDGRKIYCSTPAQSAENVTVAASVCRPLPKSRTVLPGSATDIIENTRLLGDHVRRRKSLNSWTSPVKPKIRNALYGYARAIQHEIGVRPTEGELEGSFNGGRAGKYPFLPYYQLGRALYLLGNCPAALPALKESQRQNVFITVDPERTALPKLIDICTRQRATLVGQWTFSPSRERYWRLWELSTLTGSE